MTEAKTHKGSCHCGAVAYEVDVDLSQVIECNCTHCYRKGLMLAFVQPDAFRLDGQPKLSEYLFNTHNIRHQFCPNCGVEPFARGTDPKGNEMVAINVRCLPDVEPFSLKTARYDGLSKG